MEDVRRHVGRQIRRCRQAAGLTAEVLAQAIHKSKSTVSKYESGEISLDVETLLEIAQVLRVSPSALLRVEEQAAAWEKTGLFSHREYLYIFDGRGKRITRSAVDHFHGAADGSMSVMFFYDVPSFEDTGKCRCLYTGQMTRHGFVRSYSCTNQNNDMEQFLLYSIDSLDRPQRKVGLLTGLSSYTMIPVSMKALLFQAPQREDHELRESLLLTREDVNMAKRYNIFTLGQQAP